MKKISIIFLLMMCIILTSCGPGMSDWTYKLVNGFSISHFHRDKIVCENSGSPNYYQSDYVVRFCYNDRYICLQCVDVPEDSSKDIDKSNPQYYVIDTEYPINVAPPEPLSKQEYEVKIKELEIEGLSEWIETVPAPKGAVYPDGTVAY